MSSSHREMVHVYLTSEEKSKTENEAKKLGISLSSYIKVRLFSKNLSVILFFLSLIIFGAAFSEKALAEIDLMSFEASLFDSAGDPLNGNISIEIYDDASAGNLIYNSSDSFLDNITNGKLDIILGDPSSGVDLNLTYGTTYYMDLVVNNNDIDFNGIERQIFQSSVGNITQSRLNLTGTLSTHSLIPDGNATFDLGSSINYFRNLFLETLNIITPLNTSQIEDVFLLNTGDTASGDYNFDSNTLFIDSANDFIGIRTSTPANALNVIGDANFTGTLTVGGAQITPSSNVSGGGTSGNIIKFTDTASIGNSIILESSDKIAIGTGTPVPTHLLSVFGSGNFTNDLIVFGLLDIGNLISNIINTTHIVDRTLLSDDLADSSINTTLVLDRTLLSDDLADSSVNTTLVVDRTLLSDDLADSSVNTTHLVDGTILEADLGFSALLRTDNVAFTNSTDEEFENNLSVEDSLILDYIFYQNNTVVTIENISVNQDLFTAGNITANDSLLSDYIFPKAESFTRIDNITINQDLRVLGNSYLGSFSIKDELIIGSNNISSTSRGFGTTNPEQVLGGSYNHSLATTNILSVVNQSNGETRLAVEGNSVQLDLIDAGGIANEKWFNLLVDGGAAKFRSVKDDGSDIQTDNILVMNFSTGNVGIGTTSPASRLTIKSPTGNVFVQKILSSDDQNLFTFEQKTTDGASRFDMYDASAVPTIKLDTAGDTYFNGGNVGIGTTSPGTKLEVVGTVNISTGGSGTPAPSTGADNLVIEGSGDIGISLMSANAQQSSIKFGIPGTGNESYTAINSLATTHDLQFVTGDAQRLLIAASDGTFTGSASNDISDIRLKENITEIDSALDKLIQLRGVSFTWKPEAKMTARPQLGVLAQEVEPLFPELVINTSIAGDGYKSVQYGGFVAPFIEAIKELNVKIESQNNAIQEQQKQIEELRKELDKIKKNEK